ncbi:hypothetical protein SEPCBS119000_002343 [Sporothrix epigloea]|uniref:Chromo shadow domain-containing protein n=1 Tax=Sporothrix epigloea TaxID=1892477 RepID=A0ABP0DIX5_9PEZI
MPHTFNDDVSSSASDAAVTTTPLATRRGKRNTSYSDASENGDDIGGSHNKILRKSSHGLAIAAKEEEESVKDLVEGDIDDGSDKDNTDDKDDENDGDDRDPGIENDDDNADINNDEAVNDDKDNKDEENDDEDADKIGEDEVNASEILSEYIAKVGGRAKLLEEPSKGRKRGRPSTGATRKPASKRTRKSASHTVSRKSPERVQQVFIPPSGSWEDSVTDVEMYRGDDNDLRVFLTWKNGSKTQHAAREAYTRCPQKILEFYESRISFKAP